MSELENGTYATSGDKVVTYWPAPDKDGNGEDVWEDRYDNEGRSLGRHRVKDAAGNVLKRYKAPNGYEDHRSFDGSENYVLRNPDGTIYRNANGEAVNIQPGQAVALHANGQVEVLKDEYARFVFANAHQKVNDDITPVDIRGEDFGDVQDGEEETPAAPKKAGVKATPATVNTGGSK